MRGMSAFGPKRTSVVALHMSAFGGKADIELAPIKKIIGSNLKACFNAPWPLTSTRRFR